MAATRRPRVKILSRIYAPEAGAAAFRLASLAGAFAASGAEVDVMTTTPPQGLVAEPTDGVRVSRWPVLRNRQGYVRGYLQYLSFDIPAFFRILCGTRADVVICEPPPTSVFLTVIAARLRRTPVVSYAPDIWSDASEGAGTPVAVVRALRGLERFGWTRSLGVVAVNQGVAKRVSEIAPGASVAVVGNGVDTREFASDGPRLGAGRFMVYAGTVSEWQGADLFIRAVNEVKVRVPGFRLVFVGQGSAWEDLKSLAAELDAPVDFVPPVPAAEAAGWLRGAVASVASIKPGQQYDFAFPTKTFASWACGTPVLYAGPGPAREVLSGRAELGVGVDYDLAAVTEAMERLASEGCARGHAEEIAEWARQNVSLERVSHRVVAQTRTWLRSGASL